MSNSATLSPTHLSSAKIARNAAIGFAATLAAFGGLHLSAQAIASHNSNAPVTFDAGRIEYQDRQDRVVLSGNVIIDQAGLRLTAPRTQVNFTNNGKLDVRQILATGGVLVTRGSESARGDVAIYDLNRRIITMAGNVRLNRNGDTLNGGRLTIDLRSGVSSVDGSASGSTSATGTGVTTGSNGRVSGSFSVPDREN